MIIIDFKDRRPIYEQVMERFQELILKGVLKPDEQLPSVRNLAMELSINPNTIQRAYTELERRGFIYSVKGRGSFISANGQLVQCKKEEIFSTLEKVVREANDIGITEAEFIEKITMCYEEVRKDD